MSINKEKPALKPANENPWYRLVTLHGEQVSDHFDDELDTKNRGAFSRWVDAGTNAELRRALEADFPKRVPLPLPEAATTADFSHTRFDHPICLMGFVFPCPVDFRSAIFSTDANFQGVRFNNKTNFSSATFRGETKFNSAQFNTGGVDFQSAKFCKGVDFHTVTFADANFNSANFSNSANFHGAVFTGIGGTTFRSAVFSGDADFGSAKFLLTSGADFDSATFSKTASFNAAKFNIASFKAAKFSGQITFKNAEFEGSANFAFAHFKALPPDFRGAKMHEATEWHGVSWPNPPKTEEDARQQVYGYERLKQEMERLKKHEDEQNIFRKELRARRELLPTLSGEWLLNLAYEVLSDYGISYVRPVLWLFAVFAIGVDIFKRAPLNPNCGAPMPTELAIKLSFANILVFLPDKREIMSDPKVVECLSNTTHVVSAVQSLLSVVLLFLLVLALRNRFRMR